MVAAGAEGKGGECESEGDRDEGFHEWSSSGSVEGSGKPESPDSRGADYGGPVRGLSLK